MSQLNNHHRELDEHGIGKCSVPMWVSPGVPAGFCDKPAYGNYLPGAAFTGYVPALACPEHGGPDSRVFLDGDLYCAVYPDFVNIAESPAGFGATPEEARANLKAEVKSVPPGASGSVKTDFPVNMADYEGGRYDQGPSIRDDEGKASEQDE